MNQRRRPTVVVLVAILLPCAARAAEPTKLECIAANDVAQDLRRGGKLLEAREKLALCVSTTCPELVREDCGQRLAEVDAVVPSLVFEALDATGRDVADVAVTMDGQRLPGKLSGLPMHMDPGEHRFVFDAEALGRAEKTLVVREGERDRHERIVLLRPVGQPAASPPALTSTAPARSSSSEDDSQRMIAFLVGGTGAVGLLVGSVLGLVSKSSYDHALHTECGNDPGGCSRQGVQDGESAHGQAAASTVAFVTGGVLLGTGAVLYFTAKKARISLGTTVGRERQGIVVSGAW
jgi:hypothetical protein